MIDKNQKLKGKDKSGVISSRFILTAILLFSIIVILIFLFAFRIISVPEYILNIFTDNGRGGNTTEFGSCEISDIEGTDPTSIIYEQHAENAYEALMSLTESNIYRRVIRTIYSSKGNTSVESATIVQSGERFRIETAYKTVIYDGKKVYVKEPTYTMTLEKESQIYNEIGITPLSYIKENASPENVVFKDSDNKKKITVIIRDSSSPIFNEYEISVENGLVLNERSYYLNEVYRALVTDKIEIMEHIPPNDDLFIIPEE
jgi:hypothetical protein